MDTRLLSTSYTFISISIRETRKEDLYSCLYKCAPRCYFCSQHYHCQAEVFTSQCKEYYNYEYISEYSKAGISTSTQCTLMQGVA